MNTHTLHMDYEPFAALAAGTKTIESRLYDEKRRRIEIGDTLVFVNRANNREVDAKVVSLLRYQTFHELFTHNDIAKFGHSSVEWLENQIGTFYSFEDQEQYGVLGIEFSLMNQNTPSV